jgi:putative peptidoglycan lipid II flippase
MTLRLPKIFAGNGQWLERQQNTILSAATVITIFNIISALSGIIRTRVFISFFNDTSISSKESLQALLVAFQIPDLIFQVIVFGAMSAAFVPIFISYKRNDEQVAFRMTSILMTVLLSAFLVVSVFVFIFARPLTMLRLGDAFTPEQITIVTNLTRIMLAGQFFLAISSFLGGILNAYQRFIAPALAPVLYNVIILLTIYLLSGQFGIYSAGIGVVIGAFVHMALQLPLVLRLGFKFTPSFNLHFHGIKSILKLTPPRIAAVSFGEIRDLLLGFFATSINNTTSMVIMNLTLNIMTAPIRFFGVPISQASLPFLSEEVAKNDMKRFKELIVQSLHQITFLILPASVLILILRVPIVRLLFGVANLPWETTVLTGKAVAIISLSIAAQGLVQLLIRAFYALKDTKTPLLITMTDVALYFGLAWLTVFVLDWGVLGLAFSTTITALSELVLVLYFLDLRINCFSTKAFIVPQLKIIASSFFMAVFLYLPFRILDEVIFNTSRTIELISLTIITATIGGLVYFYFSALFEVRELTFFTNLLTSFGPWKKQLEKTPEVLVETSVEGDNL